MASDWQMPRRADACAGCGHAFEIGEALRAFLYESRGGYERQDYCLDCQPPQEPTPLGFWKTHRPAPPTKKARAFDREAIYALLEQLEDDQRPEKVRLRFVLALLLWRKKVLKFERAEQAHGDEVWHYSVPRTDETHCVTRPALDEEQIERLSNQLEQVLAGQPEQLDLVATDTGPDLLAPDTEPENSDG